MWCVICVLFIFVPNIRSQMLPYVIKGEISYQIAGIFNNDAPLQLRAFNESITNVQMESYRLMPVILQPAKTDSFSVWKTLCANQEMRPIAIFGPQSPITDGVVRDQAAKALIPHIQATWQPFNPDIEPDEVEEETSFDEDTPTKTEEPENDELEYKNITINFYPQSDEISIAYARLLKFYDWRNFAALYEDNFGLLRVQKILAEHSEKYRISVFRLDPNESNLQVFKKLSSISESRILIDCHLDNVMKYMKEAESLHMVDYYQHYIFVNLDLSTIAEDLLLVQSNVTWLSLTVHESLGSGGHPLGPRVGHWLEDPKTSKHPNRNPYVNEFPTETLIMNDVASHVLESLKTVVEAQPDGRLESPRTFPCDVSDEGQYNKWPHGTELQNAILKKQTTGVTGNIQFDEKGRRVNYTLYVHEIYLKKLNITGIWESSNNTHINTQNRNSADEAQNSQANKHFRVLAPKSKPYFYDITPCPDEDDEECKEDNPDANYEGYSVDIIKEIFRILRENFNKNYTYEFVEMNEKTGHYDQIKKKWVGLIGHLLDQNGDLAICDLTITEERKKVVDFTVPLMTLGISILYTKEKEVTPEIFSFLNAYSLEVWMYTATAYCIVSLILFVCSRISPADWVNPQPCNKDPEELENIWNFKNCTWLTMGSIMTQGCDILPKAIGSRWVCGMWWFFAMIVCQTYIAQLAASMTSASEIEPIDSVEDLARQNKILYGAMEGGSTLEFFKNSKDKMYQKMYENMITHPVVLVSSNDEGEKRVLNGKNKYAFFMESTTIDYKLKRECELKKVGNELDKKFYGIAMPPNSPFRTHINQAILIMEQRTKLQDIKDRWWNMKKYGAKECEKEKDKSDSDEDLEMQHLLGAFIVLIVGLFFSILITAAEFMNEIRNIVIRERVGHKEAIKKELRASLNFFQLQKPVLRNPSLAGSIAPSNEKEIAEIKQEKRAAVIENFLDFEKEVQ